MATLAEVNYDSAGHIVEFAKPDFGFVAMNVLSADTSMRKVYALLPRFPNTTTVYKLGLSNEAKEDKELFEIRGDSHILDTVLPAPANGWHYYLSCHVLSNDSLYSKDFIEDFIPLK